MQKSLILPFPQKGFLKKVTEGDILIPMSQKGLAPILIILLIALAIGGYLIYSGKINLPQKQVTQTAKVDETASWKTYTSEKYGYLFKYPSGWIIQDETKKYNHPNILDVQIFNEDGYPEFGNNEVEVLLSDNVDIEKIKKTKVAGDAGMGSKSEVSIEMFNEIEIVKVVRNFFWYLENGKTEDKGTQYFIYIPVKSKYISLRGDIKNKEILDRILSTFKFINSQSTMITKEEAVILVKALPKVQNYLKIVPKGIVEFDHEDKQKDEWIIHVYEIVRDHTATMNWYSVNKTTGEIKDFFDSQ